MGIFFPLFKVRILVGEAACCLFPGAWYVFCGAHERLCFVYVCLIRLKRRAKPESSSYRRCML